MKKHPVIDETCAGCMYLGYLYPSSAAACRPNYCNYLYIVGHTRGCPAGKGCTVKKLVHPKAGASRPLGRDMDG